MITEVVYFDRIYGSPGTDIDCVGNGSWWNPVETYENALEVAWKLEGRDRIVEIREIEHEDGCRPPGGIMKDWQPEASYGWWRWRWTWFKAYCRGMPFGYREWRSRVDGFLAVEALLSPEDQGSMTHDDIPPVKPPDDSEDAVPILSREQDERIRDLESRVSDLEARNAGGVLDDLG